MNSKTPPGLESAGDSDPQGHCDSAAPPGYGTVLAWIISPDTPG